MDLVQHQTFPSLQEGFGGLLRLEAQVQIVQGQVEVTLEGWVMADQGALAHLPRPHDHGHGEHPKELFQEGSRHPREVAPFHT